MTEITIATLNTYTVTPNFLNVFNRYKAIGSYFNKSKVDVIHFQEVFTYAHLRLLQTLLKTYGFRCFQPSLFGPKGGLVIFSRLPLKGKQFVRYSAKGSPSLQSILEKTIQKGILVTSLKNQSLTLINTHLSAVLDGDYSSLGKYFAGLNSEIHEFHRLLREQKNKIVITGDFNIAKGSPLYERLMAGSLLVDVYAENQGETVRKEFVSKNHQPPWIDYMFLSPESQFRRNEIVEKKILFHDGHIFPNGKKGVISDHFGLQITLNLS